MESWDELDLPEAPANEWSRKQAEYLSRLRDLESEHAKALVPAVKAALDEQTKRADHLDNKASGVLRFSLGALGGFSVLTSLPSTTIAPKGCSLALLVAGIGLLLAAAIVAAIGAHVTRAWTGSSPASLLPDGAVRKGEAVALEKHILLDYADCFERNASAADQKGTIVQVAQLLLIVGIGFVAVGSLAVTSTVSKVDGSVRQESVRPGTLHPDSRPSQPVQP